MLVIPAFKAVPVLFSTDEKLVFVYQVDSANGAEATEEYSFVHFYQFIFCVYSHIYQSYSIRQLNRTEPFIINGEDINDIEKKIKAKYGLQDKNLSIYIEGLTKDFTKIESPYGSWLPRIESFHEFYGKFKYLFRTNAEFKETVTLFCNTIDGVKILYDNVLQEIAQLQTIVDSLLGQPNESLCKYCRRTHYDESWDNFLGKKLREYKISDQDIHLITKVKMALNKERGKFVHHAKYYNPNDPCNLIKDLAKTAEANSNIEQILEKKTEDWLNLDWINAYQFYIVAVRNLIYLKFFQA